jgi:hypothetical protein
MAHFQVRMLAKSFPHKFCQSALKPDVFAICIKKYRFLVFINCDKTNNNERKLKSANKTPLMSEVTVNNKLKLGICFKKAAQ